MARAGVDLDTTEKMTVLQLDKILDAAKMPTQKRIETKHNLAAAGLLA